MVHSKEKGGGWRSEAEKQHCFKSKGKQKRPHGASWLNGTELGVLWVVGVLSPAQSKRTKNVQEDLIKLSADCFHQFSPPPWPLSPLLSLSFMHLLLQHTPLLVTLPVCLLVSSLPHLPSPSLPSLAFTSNSMSGALIGRLNSGSTTPSLVAVCVSAGMCDGICEGEKEKCVCVCVL